MALLLKSTVEVMEGCYGFSFIDSTGSYSATNTGGYGAPNVATSAIISSKVKVYPPKATVPYEFEFTISSNAFTDATLLKPDGIISNIFSNLTGLVFPFSVGNEFEINETYLDYSNNTSVIDGVWKIEYEVSSSTATYITTSYVLPSCTATSCIQKAFINLKDCGCDDAYFQTAQLADAFLKSATYSLELGLTEKAQSSIDKANEICSNNCKSC